MADNTSSNTTVTIYADKTVTVSFSQITLDSIAISPSNPTIALGRIQQFTATGTYSDNSTADITNTVIWTSSDNTVATIEYGDFSYDKAYSVAVDGSGNAYVAGYISGAMPGQTSSGSDDGFIFKYDSLGNELWIHRSPAVILKTQDFFVWRMDNRLFAIASPPWAILWHYVTKRRSLPCPPAYLAGAADLLRNMHTCDGQGKGCLYRA